MFDKIPDLTQPHYAPLLGGLMAFLRAWYRGKRWKARMLEGLMMGIALLGVIPILTHFGLDERFATAFAGWAGYMGVDYLADKLGKKAEREIGL
jgi:lambda family phage holin